MSTITTIDNPMMSSKEIAELTGKRHDHVIRDIRKMVKSIKSAAEDGSPELGDQLNQGLTEIMCPLTYRTSEFMMNRHFSEVLVTGYDVVRRAKVIHRWLEIEAQAKQPQLPDFNNPVEAARAWADAKEEAMIAESLALEHQKKIEEDAPKVEFYEAVTQTADTFDMGQVAKIFDIKGMGRNKLIEWLRQQGIFRPNTREPYQRYVNAGYFKVVTTYSPASNNAYTKTVAYQKGVDFIYRELVKAGLI